MESSLLLLAIKSFLTPALVQGFWVMAFFLVIQRVGDVCVNERKRLFIHKLAAVWGLVLISMVVLILVYTNWGDGSASIYIKLSADYAYQIIMSGVSVLGILAMICIYLGCIGWKINDIGVRLPAVGIKRSIVLFVQVAVILVVIRSIWYYFVGYDEQSLSVANLVKYDDHHFLMAYVFIGVLVPIVEETFFRGVIFHALRFSEPVVQISISAMLYSVCISVSPQNGVAVFLTGLAAGYLYHVSKTIIIPVMLHLVFLGFELWFV